MIVDTANPIFYYSDWAELMMSESGGYLQLSWKYLYNYVVVDTANHIFYYSDLAEPMGQLSGRCPIFVTIRVDLSLILY